MSEHIFQLQATWQGGRLGTGDLKGNGLHASISVPQELGGPGVGTNPEELIIGAAMNCYIITLAAILEKREINLLSLTLQSEGTVSVENRSQRFSKIVHRPTIHVAQADEQMVELLQQCAHRAESACMISKAMHGNVDITVEPNIVVDSRSE